MSEATVAVSVIVPVYNVAPYVGECVASLLTQETLVDRLGGEMEVILVDDGSTDGSAELCDRLSQADSRVRVVHQRNQGLSAARNAGLDLARGRWITFVDGDDVVAPDYVGFMADLALSHDADIVVTDIVSFDGAPPHYRSPGEISVEQASVTLRRIVAERFQVESVAKLYSASILATVRFPVGMVYEDLYFAPRAFAQAGRTVFSTARLYGYRQRPGSLMDHTRRQAVSPDLIAILDANITHARGLGADHDVDALCLGYALHASKSLERLPLGAGWSRNAPFRAAYARFARDHWPMVKTHPELSPGYRALWRCSVSSPLLFRLVVGVGHWAKRRGLGRALRRHAG